MFQSGLQAQSNRILFNVSDTFYNLLKQSIENKLKEMIKSRKLKNADTTNVDANVRRLSYMSLYGFSRLKS